MLSRDLGSLGPGNHVLDLTAGRVLPSGVYVIRLTHAGQVRATRAVIVRQRGGRLSPGS
jgi:hypothetical protein